MVHFLSCDWGTSSFRLRLIGAENAETIAFRKADRGIAATFNSLDDRKKKDPEQRLLFYLHIIQEHISEIEQDQKISLKGVPLVISGMASSSIGMAELPYRNLPFNIDGSDIEAAYYEVSASFAHPVLLISGVKSEVDVMRGEETQLIGTIRDSTAAEGQELYIFPGTHSKHIVVKDKRVTDFKTYMTGEFFELLSKQSILKGGVERDDDLQAPKALQSFTAGVLDAKGANLLQMAFRVRTNTLFEKFSKRENYHYLSGLLIGAELDEITPSDYTQVSVCSDSVLTLKYETALKALGLKENVHVFPPEWADEAVVRGQLKIYKQFTSKL
ncbi:2-dehydro-3-deoxygalactonokinase [Pontibacter pamirensis]|uniref:2-dehydro-3-deoxygalactonokinase n=1 Tax=Pontibacter pamirensis TaxID=2562824 RepID=UPI00138A3706|nr:2-dehydro-3-deoxygalactonokinase [Pontibacter pamirensis]